MTGISMVDRVWYQIHPAIGCRPLAADEQTHTPFLPEAEQPRSWVTLDDDQQTDLEIEFFIRCIRLAVGAGRMGWVRGDILTYDLVNEHVDGPVEDCLDRLFSCAAPTSLQIMADDEMVMRVGCDWGQAAALLSSSDADSLQVWARSDPRLGATDN